MSRGVRYVAVMPIHGRHDAQKAAALLAPAFQAENWIWSDHAGAYAVPGAVEIEILIVTLWNELLGHTHSMCMSSGGLSVEREHGREVPAVLWIDPKLASHILLAGTDSRSSQDSKKEGEAK